MHNVRAYTFWLLPFYISASTTLNEFLAVFTSAKEVMFLPDFCSSACLSVCDQDNSKSYGRILLKFWGNVGHGTNYQWFIFGGDPEEILDSGSLWNFRYHCVTIGCIREPLAKRRRWGHLANNIALAEVLAGYDCFLVYIYNICGLIKVWKVTEQLLCTQQQQ